MRSAVRQLTREFAGDASRVPVVRTMVRSAYRRFFNSAAGEYRLFAGVYPDFAAAQSAIPDDRLAGYDNAPSAGHMMGEWLGVYPSDYPVLLWLTQTLTDNCSIFDWGGNVGIKYYAFRKYLSGRENMRWTVCDVPAVVNYGHDIKRREDAPGLAFTTDPKDMSGADVLLGSGIIQFIGDPFCCLASVDTRPAHIILNKVPAYEGPSVVTLHNNGISLTPYHVFNRFELVQRIETLGFELVDEWTSPEISCTVPFFPEHSVKAYSGFYFRKIA